VNRGVTAARVRRAASRLTTGGQTGPRGTRSGHCAARVGAGVKEVCMSLSWLPYCTARIQQEK